MSELNRRDFLALAGAGAAAAVLPTAAKAGINPPAGWYAFSRVFQKFGLERAADLLVAAGYTGVEWTVRPGGFVEPSRVTAELPKAIEVARRHGLAFANIVVEFLDPYEGKNLDLLKCAADCGVANFRPAYFKYDYSEKAKDGLERIRKGFDRLEKAARETGVRCIYQNHSSYNRRIPLFGSLCWDLWEVLKDRDPKWLGVQYDVMHARAEQGPSWQRGMGLLAPWIRTLCLKDFKFAEDAKAPGDWKRVLLPAGQGIVDWKEFKSICQLEGIGDCFYSVHYDYNFPENDYDAALKAAKADLDFFKKAL